MRLLLCLAERAGEVVSIDELLEQVWSGVIVTSDSVYQAVASLRRLLGDDPRQPDYVATVPRLGYRMVATVSPWVDSPVVPVLPVGPPGVIVPTVPSPDSAERSAPAASDARAVASRRTGVYLAAGAVLFVVVVGTLLYRARVENANRATAAASTLATQKSVAVLPFLDLTEEMKEEYFADGITEELIDKLSKIPGLRVPSPTSSFYFKGKHVTVADIAKALGVTYVLDGSLRKSGGMLRVAARLIRADSGFVVWSETYDRRLDDRLMVQDDIAGEVTKALQASIEARPEHTTSQ
jgi:TolB-like protein